MCGGAHVSALIAAGASLLGGLFSSRSAKKQQDRANKYDDPEQMRKRAEAAGFNPLLWAGQGNVTANIRPNNFMGAAIANAGLAASEWQSEKKRFDLEKTRLEMDREKLDHLIETTTIRPKVGGLYSGNVSIPKNSTRPTVGGGVAAAAQAAKSPMFNPETPFNTSETPLLADPSKVMRDDGMTAANPDSPPEFEGDVWSWAREGTLIPNLGEIWNRNTGNTETQKAAQEKANKKWEARKERLRKERAEEKRKRRTQSKPKPLRDYYGPPGSRTGF